MAKKSKKRAILIIVLIYSSQALVYGAGRELELKWSETMDSKHFITIIIVLAATSAFLGITLAEEGLYSDNPRTFGTTQSDFTITEIKREPRISILKVPGLRNSGNAKANSEPLYYMSRRKGKSYETSDYDWRIGLGLFGDVYRFREYAGRKISR